MPGAPKEQTHKGDTTRVEGGEVGWEGGLAKCEEGVEQRRHGLGGEG